LSPGEVRTVDLRQVGDDPSEAVPMLASPVLGSSLVDPATVIQQQHMPPQEQRHSPSPRATSLDSTVIVEELKTKAR
jgi:hypothetical protein